MNINVNDYTYHLPPERIAKYPLAERDQSKLLVYKNGKIGHKKFADISQLLPSDSTLVFNDTKVIPARLLFYKKSGATIEIFLLHPVKPSILFAETLQASHTCSWKCAIGNLRRWTDTLLSKNIDGGILTARLGDRQSGIVEFSWNTDDTFGVILQHNGNTPLPPYLNRGPEPADAERYQTIYSSRPGAVAAPTAGLHFTPKVLESLNERNIKTDFLSLHVSAGTFLPIKATNAFEHKMHQEQIVVNRQNVENLMNSKTIIAIGTTSLRTLESIYWYGVKLLNGEASEFVIVQDDPYLHNEDTPVQEALAAVHAHMKATDKDSITGETSIYIVPGYTFRLCRGLVTNFHQPASTLILLVAALIGEDWKRVYEEALANEYRFLSYGDSSLLLRDNL